jgi:Helix-turn-helix domain
MYALRVSSGAPPAEDAKYDGDHRCSRWVRTRERWRSRRAETPLKEFTSRVTATCGGEATSSWTWSSSPSISTSSAPKSAHTLANTSPRVAQVLAGQHPTPIPGHQDQLHVEGRDDLSAATVVVLLSHRPKILSGMLVRYRYRIDPTGVQRQALARAFGCARVVYNDALAERRRAYQAEEKLGDTELQRRGSPRPSGPRSGPGWPRSPLWCWSRPARTPGVPPATGSTRARAGAGPPGRAASVPNQARPPVDPAHPQRLRPARDQAVCGQGRGGAGALVAGVAVGAIERHRPPRAGRPLLRLLRGRSRPDPATSGAAHRRDRPRPGLVRGGRGQRRDRRAGRQPAAPSRRAAAARPRTAAAAAKNSSTSASRAVCIINRTLRRATSSIQTVNATRPDQAGRGPRRLEGSDQPRTSSFNPA